MFCAYCNRPLADSPPKPLEAVSKTRWLQLFALLYVIGAVIYGPFEYVEAEARNSPALAALVSIGAKALGYSGGTFGIGFLVSLLAKPERQFAVVVVASLVMCALGAIAQYKILG